MSITKFGLEIKYNEGVGYECPILEGEALAYQGETKEIDPNIDRGPKDKKRLVRYGGKVPT